MSLPYQDLPWLDLGIDIKGLRIGVMMQAGIGMPLDPEDPRQHRAGREGLC